MIIINESIYDDARYFLDMGYTENDVWNELDEEGCNDEYIQDVLVFMNELAEEDAISKRKFYSNF